ncbi:Bug family tripartite tricarboxylate transporter substrate binding protein [Polynucleobacter rarus]|uniref:Bug family tripartite tricarboxylate transporter substrate binding protein n=1 Tax=Polynucleobacter rarus TaxID=556055 RepID=UPI000D3E82BD|nr:tripartite tricarboxylate transporter substrate binding protein [Polynucleobacter rarus]
MTVKVSRCLQFFLVCLYCVGAVFDSYSQTLPYPSKPIRIFVGSVPGASSDTYARIVGDALSKNLHQSIQIENRSGASGIIATTAMLAMPADGYQIQLIYTPHTLSPYLFKKLSYDSIKDVTGIGRIVTAPLVLAVSAKSNIKSYQDLIDLGKSKSLNYGSAGIGSGGHLSAEMLKIYAGLDVVHAPYRGASPAATAVAAGDVDFAFIAQITARELMLANKIRILAVTSKTRSPLLPNIPTMQELGLKDFEFNNWFGLIASAKTPSEIVNKLSNSLKEVLKDSEIRKKLTSDGSEIVVDSPEQFTKFLADDSKKWGPLIQQIGLKGED